MFSLAIAVSKFFELTFMLLLVAILLTWVPGIKWEKQPFAGLRAFSEIFLGPFRKLIPPIGMIDISPIVAFFVWSFIANFLVGLLAKYGI